MKRYTTAAVALVALGLSACRTETKAVRINPGQYLITEKDGWGPNPEKGLIGQGCLKDGRSIRSIRAYPSGHARHSTLVVTCGERVR